jgi:hypothetical protein
MAISIQVRVDIAARTAAPHELHDETAAACGARHAEELTGPIDIL